MKEEFNDNSERKFSFKEYWGPEYLKPYLTFSRKGKHFCIYCGAESGTREHVPSKVFLDEPYPEDLPVLPACFNCNNGFSDDEAYVFNFSITYKDDLDYQDSGSLILIHSGKKLEVAAMSENEAS